MVGTVSSSTSNVQALRPATLLSLRPLEVTCRTVLKKPAFDLKVENLILLLLFLNEQRILKEARLLSIIFLSSLLVPTDHVYRGIPFVTP